MTISNERSISKPYVYKLIHKITGQFYIGYRCRNKLPAEIDLPQYQSSSKTVKMMGFDNFSWAIVQEFDDADSAYDFEQSIIYESFSDPLCLNRHCAKDKQNRFRNAGHSEDTRRRLSEALTGKKYGPQTQEHRDKVAAYNRGRIVTQEVRDKIANSLKGSKHSEETKAKLRNKKLTDEHKAKISAAMKARRSKLQAETNK